VTVLVTTHYMEEAARADRIGFMRAGRMLREGTPGEIKVSLGSADLDVAFFRLCARDEESRASNKTPVSFAESDESVERISSSSTTDGDEVPLINPRSDSIAAEGQGSVSGLSCFRALCHKNLLVLRRNGLFMSFQAVMPVITFLVFVACVGPPLKDLRLAVYNGEGSCVVEKDTLDCPLGEGMGLFDLIAGGMAMGAKLSCSVLAQVDPAVFGSISHWPSLEAAQESVLLGQSDAVVSFAPDFSAALTRRVLATAFLSAGEIAPNETLSFGAMTVRLDATDTTIATSISTSLARSVHSFLVGYADNCSLPELARLLRASSGFDLNTTVQEAHLGHPVPPAILSVAMLPGMMALILQMLAMALTSDLLIKEKAAGLLVRDFVCGMSLTLALLANLLVMLIVVAAQIAFSVLLLWLLFRRDLSASLLLALSALFLVQALCGMTLGLLLTAIFPTIDQVIQAGISLILPRLGSHVRRAVAATRHARVADAGIAMALPGTLACNSTWPLQRRPNWRKENSCYYSFFSPDCFESPWRQLRKTIE
jgi:hypothetical protein